MLHDGPLNAELSRSSTEYGSDAADCHLHKAGLGQVIRCKLVVLHLNGVRY